MDFDNKVLFVVEILGRDVWITEAIVNTWIIMVVLIIIALYIRMCLGRFKEVPTGKQNVIEACIEAMDNFVRSSMGEENRGYGKWFFGVFVFILVSNLSGLVNLRPPTADVSTTLALSFSTFAIIQVAGLLSSPKAYAKSFVEPWPVFLPINIVSDLSIPIALGFRLFGNIVGGLIIVGMIYYLIPAFLTFGLPVFLHAYFDIFAGALQAFIFTVLSMTFIKNKISN